MELLFELDARNYQNDYSVFYCEAVRVILLDQEDLIMIRSRKYGEYKFIGGGVKDGEDHRLALKREAKEEAGIILDNELKGIGYAVEKRLSLSKEKEIFLMKSFYYLGRVKGYTSQDLQDYEREYNYEVKKVKPKEAYESNMRLGFDSMDIPWNRRDTTVLRMILEGKIKMQ